MKVRVRSVLVALVALLSALSLGTEARAQTAARYDANCNPAEFDELQQFQMKACSSFLPCGALIKVVNACGRTKDLLKNIGKALTGDNKLTIDEVVEAAIPDGPPSKALATARSQIESKLAVTRPPVSTASKTLPSGKVQYTETYGAGPSGGGTVRASIVQGDGTVFRGEMKNGRPNGLGEAVAADGLAVGGRYVDGKQTGTGFQIYRGVSTVGNFVDGEPDGMVEVAFADGSHQFWEYENGVVVQQGVRVPKGQVAIAPQLRRKDTGYDPSKLPDAYKHTMDPPKVARGATFNPARTAGAASPVDFSKHPSLGYNQPHTDVIARRFGRFQGADAMTTEVVSRCSVYLEGYLRNQFNHMFPWAWDENYKFEVGFFLGNPPRSGNLRLAYIEADRADLGQAFSETRARLLARRAEQSAVGARDVPGASMADQTYLDLGGMCLAAEVANIKGYGGLGEFPRIAVTMTPDIH